MILNQSVVLSESTAEMVPLDISKDLKNEDVVPNVPVFVFYTEPDARGNPVRVTDADDNLIWFPYLNGHYFPPRDANDAAITVAYVNGVPLDLIDVNGNPIPISTAVYLDSFDRIDPPCGPLTITRRYFDAIDYAVQTEGVQASYVGESMRSWYGDNWEDIFNNDPNYVRPEDMIV